jgi:hypothetical protein
MYANFMHRKKIYYTNIYIDIQLVRILHHTNVTFLSYTKNLVFLQNFLSSFVQKFVDSFVNSFFNNSYSF